MYKRICCKKLAETSFKRSFLFFSTKANISEILTTQLELDDNTIKNVEEKVYNIAPQLSEERIIQNCSIFKKLTVDTKNVTFLVDCLRLEPKIVTNRILLLQEMGVNNINLDYIFRFPRSMRQTLRTFIKNHNLSSDHDIVKNMFNSVGILQVPTFPNLSASMHISDYYVQAMTYYKTIHLKLYHKPLLTYHRFKYQSFRQVSDIINILKTKFELNKDFLNRHPYLLDLNVDEVDDFITRFKDTKVGGENISVIVRKFPRVLLTDLNNLEELLSLFVKYNVPNCTVFYNLPILTMKKHVFIERYRVISAHPELCVWLRHSKILYTIIAYKLVMERIHMFQVMNTLKLVSFYSIYSSRKRFLRTHAQGRHPRTARKKYLKFIFNEELGSEMEYLIKYVTRHPHWKVVPLCFIYKTLVYLKKYYSKEDIIANVHIIFYPQNAVEKIRKIINEKFSPEEGYNFTDRQRLALCLYLLEKSHHFNGDAVWQIMYPDEDDKTNIVDVSESLDKCVNNDNAIDTKYTEDFT